MNRKNNEKWQVIPQMSEEELRAVHLHNNLFNNKSSPNLVGVFEEIIEIARKYQAVTGRPLPVFGELGEIYAEIMFGIKRNKPNAQGSDGRRGSDLIEVKTISPFKKSATVNVKRQGSFNQVLVVKIDENYEFSAKLVFRDKLPKGNSKFVQINWEEIERKYQ